MSGEGYFEEIVFPRIMNEKKILSPPSLTSSSINISQSRITLETIVCSKKSGWVSLVECINCSQAEKTLQEILETNEGC